MKIVIFYNILIDKSIQYSSMYLYIPKIYCIDYLNILFLEYYYFYKNTDKP